MMRLRTQTYTLKLTHKWTIASKLGPGGDGGMNDFPVAWVELESDDGTVGWGEAAPSSRYGETVETSLAFLERVDPARLSFTDIPGSMRYLESIAPDNFAPKGAINLALLDGAAKRAGQPVHAFLGLPFQEAKHLTSFSIGIDAPDMIRRKVLQAERYPILKLKLGVPHDRENLAALRSAAPGKPVRVDANEAWKSRDEALRQIERVAGDAHIQFIEQPMPAGSDPKDLAWLKDRSPLPLFADESYLSAQDISLCRDCFHGVNVKLMKTGGISGAKEALEIARRAGLQTMIGCMIETSMLISAGAHLAELADHLDLDGNLLVDNDPFQGVTVHEGVLSFAQARATTGLRVSRRPEPC
jgi:L-alanine-DL-glutamate epimerase-like enolase superfamily enzyme